MWHGSLRLCACDFHMSRSAGRPSGAPDWACDYVRQQFDLCNFPRAVQLAAATEAQARAISAAIRDYVNFAIRSAFDCYALARRRG